MGLVLHLFLRWGRALRVLLSVLAGLILLPCAVRADEPQPPQITTGEFVAKCQADLQYCAKSIIDNQDMDLLMSTLGVTRRYCVPVGLQPKDRTAPVMAYIASHPDLESKPAYQALREAAVSLWPCKR